MRSTIVAALSTLACVHSAAAQDDVFPMVINTWGGAFQVAAVRAFEVLETSASESVRLDALEEGCKACEENRCDGTVGYGGSPDESGETTLDAMMIDGETMNAGAVSGMRRIKDAVGVARMVMERTRHTLLSGDLATEFAVEMGFEEEDLSTESSRNQNANWRANNCQPNYRTNVVPDPSTSCGPYTPAGLLAASIAADDSRPPLSKNNHDTLSMVVLDRQGRIASATTTNGARNKIPGRVGDGPIPGAGGYSDNTGGGCGATGDGDILMRFSPCYQAVENMRNGMLPKEACEDALARVARRIPQFDAGMVVVNMKGEYAGCAYGWGFYSYSVRTALMDSVEVVPVPPFTLPNGSAVAKE